MRDAEAAGKQFLQLVRVQLRGVEAEGTGQHDVSRQRALAGPQRPHVHVVHGLDALGGFERVTNVVELQVVGYRVQQHPRRVAQQSQRGDGDERGDEQRRGGIEPFDAEHERAERGDDDRG